jgi:hypothetical protein
VCVQRFFGPILDRDLREFIIKAVLKAQRRKRKQRTPSGRTERASVHSKTACAENRSSVCSTFQRGAATRLKFKKKYLFPLEREESRVKASFYGLLSRGTMASRCSGGTVKQKPVRCVRMVLHRYNDRRAWKGEIHRLWRLPAFPFFRLLM